MKFLVHVYLDPKIFLFCVVTEPGTPCYRGQCVTMFDLETFLKKNCLNESDPTPPIKLCTFITVTGVGSSPALVTCETSHVLLAGVPGGFPGVLPFPPPTDWLISI